MRVFEANAPNSQRPRGDLQHTRKDQVNADHLARFLRCMQPVVDPALVGLPPAPLPHSPTSDFGYAFEIIHEFLETFHAQIKQDPFSVLLLRATFLKIVR